MIQQLSVCVDVGGTFTDCLAQWQGDSGNWECRCIKVLSTGLIRCAVGTVIDARSVQITVPAELVAHLPDKQLPPDFFAGADASIVFEDRRLPLGSIESWDTSGSIVRLAGRRLPEDLREVDGVMLEIDCGWEAPVLATRLLLGLPPGESLPPVSVRLGTTRGTNALLTRSGADTALVVTEGFGDVLEIGEQDRPELFDLAFQKPLPLTRRTIEVSARMDADGKELVAIDEEYLEDALTQMLDAGAETLAICLMHAHVNDSHEREVERIARSAGFAAISRSSEVAPLIKLVSRAETTTLDAYLNPILSAYTARVRHQYGGPTCDLRVMTSGGNLVASQDFRGRDSVLSGPAGGIVGLQHVVRGSTDTPYAIGLDMGGTSTDVSRFDGQAARRFETKIAGLRVMTPMMDIHTVAAGGGSICDCVSGRLVVGPESAGASPGPACYGRGGPLTVTDVNLWLGRLLADRFPFPLHRGAAQERLEHVASKLEQPLSLEALAEGFLDIAVTHMAEAVRAITTARGVDVRDHALVGFGGAAAQHLCRIADSLGMKEIIDHPRASVLSAVGMGVAPTGAIHTVGVYQPLDQITQSDLYRIADEAKARATESIDEETGDPRSRFEVDCRYQGTDVPITVALGAPEAIEAEFHEQHRRRFGYRRTEPLEVVCVRCECTVQDADQIDRLLTIEGHDSRGSTHDRTTEVWTRGQTVAFQLFERTDLIADQTIPGGSLVVSDQSTLVVEPHWQGKMLADGTIVLRPGESDSPSIHSQSAADDPVQLEIVARRLQSIADSMGEVLRRTAVSVNVKERLDFSCAVFRHDGALVASAPHVPVHLGAMGHTVRHLAETFPAMSDGDCYVSNDPYAGGSHLPDVTLVTPVFCGERVISGQSQGRPDFFVASRAHHAEIGGTTPGSMPPMASSLAEEGVLIRGFALVKDGQSNEEGLRRILTGGAYPSRNPDENLADLRAQIAAGREGAALLKRMTAETDVEHVTAMMGRLLDVAADSVARWIEKLPQTPMTFEDQLDDGTPLAVELRREGDTLRVDFTGTGNVHPFGFNATPSIASAAVLYVLRCYCDSNLPLCDGALRNVRLVLPEGLLSPPGDPDPTKCAAVVAGNVETSQRIVDVVLGALGASATADAPTLRAVAASQGTMNNLLLGNDSFGYYETIGGGAGATVFGSGADAVHTHMTNTRITDPEVLESRLPLRLIRFAIRRGSGGDGKHGGGCGIVREIELLAPLTVSIISSRRTTCPYGVAGGGSGKPGKNTHLPVSGDPVDLGNAATLDVQPGDRLRIETPGGGGWGSSTIK